MERALEMSPRPVGLALALGLAIAPAAAGQGVVRVAAGAGQVGVSADGNWRGDGERPAFANLWYREWFTVPLTGALFHPRIFSYSLTLRPQWSQRTSSGLPDALTSQHLGFFFGARLLSAQPVSLTFHSARLEGSTEGGFGTERSFETASWGAALSLRNRWLPATVNYSSRATEDFSRLRAGLAPFSRSDRTRTLRIAAENRKLTAAWIYTDFEDRLGAGDFRTSALHVHHRLRWGKGSSLESSYDRLERTITLPYTRSTWRERVQIQHTKTTSSRFFFERHSSDTEGAILETRTLSGELQSRPIPALSLGLAGSARSSRFTDGGERIWTIGPQVGFTATLPHDIRLTGSASVGYQQRRPRDSLDGFVYVVNEPHRVDPTRSVVLEESGVDTATVVLRSADEAVVFVAGVDYELVVIGALVEIRILPGSRIQEGETILVSYRFLPTIFGRREDALTSRYSLSLRWKGWEAHHSRTRRASETTGTSSVLSADLDETLTGLRTVQRAWGGRVRLEALRRTRESVNLDFTAYEVRAGLELPGSRDLRWGIDATGRWTREGKNWVRAFTAGPVAHWAPIPTLRLRAAANLWIWSQDGARPERILAGNLQADWSVASLELTLRYFHDRRERPERIAGNRLFVSLVRRL